MDTLRREMFRCRRNSNAELTCALSVAVALERKDLVGLLIRLGEFDARKLERELGHPDIWDYCRRVLRYSRSAAGRRISAARAGRRYPSLLAMLTSGEISLVSVAMLEAHLTPQNRRRLLRQARGKGQEEIAELIAAERQCPPVKRDTIRVFGVVKARQSSPQTSTKEKAVSGDLDLFESAGNGLSTRAGIAPP